jgi:RNA polymerase sigma-70 factor (ECF subfamily)
MTPAPLDEPTLRRLYAESVGTLYAYVSRRCGGVRENAEDVTQETWLRAVRNWRANGVPDNPLAWLTTVARNLIINRARDSETDVLHRADADDVLDAIERNDLSESEERARAVTAALARLPESEARLLEAFHFDRCRVARIAEVYGVSERAIEGRLRRARERLRKELILTLNPGA